MELNQEKLEVLKNKGNTLVIANPGTGKTLLLAYKYAQLINEGVNPKDIICLTFTNKAAKEMEDRIIKILKLQGKEIDYSNLNVYTFHAYALEEIGREETIPTNLLRYSIYKYFKENETLRYDDGYLIGTIVPKMENLIRYLKSFGILPDDINLDQVKSQLTGYKKLSKEEMDRFAEYFVDIYRHYEEVKKGMGIDYADMLLEFTKLKNKRKFKYVLVDELQDVNTIEADIALQSGETFFAVGDKKQAIFGFQGGSILNFKKFAHAKTYILKENFRSANAILDYAREYILSKTTDEQHKEELRDLHNPRKGNGAKPIVYELPEEDGITLACELAARLSKEHNEIAIIARTNLQILRLSQELQKRGIEHSSTYFSASSDARTQVISFLRGVLSNDPNDVRNAMFTPFFPIPIQDAFELSELGDGFTLDKVYERCPEFKRIRDSVRTIEDVNTLFASRILPIAAAYGKEYFLAAIAMHQAFNEALSVMDRISFREVLNYLKASDILADESDVEKQIILTTVHKAKGRQFPVVIYVPQKMRDKDNFQDEVVKAILRTKGIDAEEELNEEALRIDFVAMTRAEDSLHIIPDKIEEYTNDYCERRSFEMQGVEGYETSERLKRAYTLFVNGSIDQSQKLLSEHRAWVVDFITKHFEGIDHLSFSSLKTDPLLYLKYNILGLEERSYALSLGSDVHALAQAMVNGEPYEITENMKPYAHNITEILSQVKAQYPEVVSTEQKIELPLEQLIGTGEKIRFIGFMDALFRNSDSYLILDWKTDKDDSRGYEHRIQLEAYRQALSKSWNIPLEKIKIAVAYIGLRPVVNLGRIDYKLDMGQPSSRSFETFRARVNVILEWKKNPDLFFRALMEKDDLLSRAILEEYRKEKGK